jgi:hypothetical protein
LHKDIDDNRIYCNELVLQFVNCIWPSDNVHADEIEVFNVLSEVLSQEFTDNYDLGVSLKVSNCAFEIIVYWIIFYDNILRNSRVHLYILLRGNDSWLYKLSDNSLKHLRSRRDQNCLRTNF